MKKMYRDLQKDHMKQLKEELGRERGGGEEGGKGKGFVSQCLVRVECEGEEEVTCGQLKVHVLTLSASPSNSLSVHLCLKLTEGIVL